MQPVSSQQCIEPKQDTIHQTNSLKCFRLKRLVDDKYKSELSSSEITMVSQCIHGTHITFPPQLLVLEFGAASAGATGRRPASSAVVLNQIRLLYGLVMRSTAVSSRLNQCNWRASNGRQ